jgi:hypothetical protein
VINPVTLAAAKDFRQKNAGTRAGGNVAQMRETGWRDEGFWVALWAPGIGLVTFS